MGLFKRKDSDVWWLSFTANGKRYRRSSETNDKELARRILKSIEGKVVDGKWFDKPQSIKMSEVIDKYMQEISPLKKASHERNLQLAAHLKKFFGNCLLEDVRAPLLSRYRAQRLQTISLRGRPISPDTVRKELGFLRQIFNVAIDEWEYCKENPVRKVMKKLPKEERRVRYVLPEEAEKLRFTIPSWLRPFIVTACQTGLRRNNLINLTMDQVDFSANRIIVGKTKNGDPLGITMTATVRATLIECIRSRKVASPYLFCNEKGQKFTRHQVSMSFKRACERAGVKNLRLHDLRHDFATLMLRKRRNLVEVQHALGHKDPRMTLRYAHLIPDDLKEAFEAIDNEGTASILSRFCHGGEKEKGSQAATP
jgi:integrase